VSAPSETGPESRSVAKPWVLWVPLALFVLLFVMLAAGLLWPTPKTIDSHMIGKPLPRMELPPGVAGRAPFQTGAAPDGKPRLLNVFASWCIPCIAEAPVLMEMKRQGIRIDAVAIRDRPEDVATFLGRWGDPYERIGSDVDASLQLAIGSSGVPETFVIDGKGVIRLQHIGDIRPEDMADIVKALEDAQ